MGYECKSRAMAEREGRKTMGKSGVVQGDKTTVGEVETAKTKTDTRPAILGQWYLDLVDDCKAILVETEFTARWALVEGYHTLGLRILDENNQFEREKIYGQQIVQRIANSLEKRPRTIYYAIQFAKDYPDLNKLPEGKNTSWFQIISKYLTGNSKSENLSLVEVEFDLPLEIRKILSEDITNDQIKELVKLFKTAYKKGLL